ncbi:MAG: hypothetical protein AAFN74_00705 [Myxococcota bacterium]
MSISTPGSAQWRQANAAELNALMDRVMQQTGQQDLAQDAAAAAEKALSGIYHQAVVDAGGNRQAGLQAVQRHSESVFRLAGLVPQITGDDPAAASTALRQAQQVLRDAGIDDPQFIYPWLRQNVRNDQVLRGAGLDPQRVRHVDSPWSHADLDGLMGITRQMLTEYRGQDGETLSSDEIDRQMDRMWSYAQQHGVGNSYVPPAPAVDPGSEGQNEDPSAAGENSAETFSVLDLNIPRRV